AAGVVQHPRLVLIGKGGAARNATAALLATTADFTVFSALVTLGAASPPAATFVGAACGGVINFTLNKCWTFTSSGSSATMFRRYSRVSTTSALLNPRLVAALLWIPAQHVTIAWLIARALIFLGWNYPLQRDYVFAHVEDAEAHATRC